MQPTSHYLNKCTQNIYLEGKQRFAFPSSFFVGSIKHFKCIEIKTRASVHHEMRIGHVGCAEIINQTKLNKSKQKNAPEALLSFGAPLRAGFSPWIQTIFKLWFKRKVRCSPWRRMRLSTSISGMSVECFHRHHLI